MSSRGTWRVTGAAIIVIAASVLVLQQRSISRLRDDNARLSSDLAAAQRPVAAVNTEPAADAGELLRLRAQEREMIRLRGEVTLLRQERNDLSNRLAAVANKVAVAPSQSRSTQHVDTAWVQSMLGAPLAQQGLSAGAVRGKLLRGEGGVSSSEIAFRDALGERQLNQTLERTPADFAEFQTAFIQGTVGISEPAKLQQIHNLIRQTYEHAVANGLDVASKPAESDAWVQQRFQLDRRATAAVEQLLTPEERKSFGRAFIGVMGVDLGNGNVDRSNYPKGFLGP